MFDDDEYKNFIKKFKKYFNFYADDDIKDIEFYIYPSNNLGNNSKSNSNNKGIKISYHYEKGMENPDIKIQGDINKSNINDYLKNLDFLKNNTKFKEFIKPKIEKNKSKRIIDVNELSLKQKFDHKELLTEEPYNEFHESNLFIEFLLEVPGIREKDILITINDEKETLIFSAENKDKRYHKSIQLPYKVYILNETLEINNGIVLFKCKKK